MKLYVKESTGMVPSILEMIGDSSCSNSGKTIREVATELSGEELSDFVIKHPLDYTFAYYACYNNNISLDLIRIILDEWDCEPAKLWNLLNNLNCTGLISSEVRSILISSINNVFSKVRSSFWKATTIKGYLELLNEYCVGQSLLSGDEQQLNSLLDKLNSLFSATKIQLGVKVNRHIVSKLDEYADNMGISKSKIVEDAIIQYIDSH